MWTKKRMQKVLQSDFKQYISAFSNACTDKRMSMREWNSAESHKKDVVRKAVGFHLCTTAVEHRFRRLPASHEVL